MRTILLSLAVVWLGWGSFAGAATEDLPIGFLPGARVVAGVRQALSPQGRLVLLKPEGPLRVIDSPEKIEAARRALAAMAQAPATVPYNLSFVIVTTKAAPPPASTPTPSVAADDFPIPDRITPPRIRVTPGGGYIVTPAVPHFTHRTVPNSVGVLSANPPLVQTKQVARQFAGSGVLGQTSIVPVQPRVADPAALRALAAKLEAVSADEPAWSAAATELEVRSELEAGVLSVTVTPQIVVAGGGGVARRIPLKACSAGIPVARGLPAPMGLLPRTDADFYRVFLGVAPEEAEAVMALRVGAEVRYLGQ